MLLHGRGLQQRGRIRPRFSSSFNMLWLLSCLAALPTWEGRGWLTLRVEAGITVYGALESNARLRHLLPLPKGSQACHPAKVSPEGCIYGIVSAMGTVRSPEATSTGGGGGDSPKGGQGDSRLANI